MLSKLNIMLNRTLIPQSKKNSVLQSIDKINPYYIHFNLGKEDREVNGSSMKRYALPPDY